jgi:ABC-type multidrug transport system ATPase subunit
MSDMYLTPSVSRVPLLQIEGLRKSYFSRWPRRKETFRLEADLELFAGETLGVMGPNGSGKTTLFELLAGSNTKTDGKVLCAGQEVHQVKYLERDRLVTHYHQSYQVRRFKRTKPSFLLESARSPYPLVHIFDEPQLNTQDGYIGFMLQFFERLKAEGRAVVICLHPLEAFQLDILREACSRFIFVNNGRVTHAQTFDEYLKVDGVREYLGTLLPEPSN